MKRPVDLGYRMPAEWHTHSATHLHWPSNRDTWPGQRLDKVERVYLDIIESLHQFEPIILLLDHKIPQNSITDKLLSRDIDTDLIKIYSIPINDVWARDCGPIFVRQDDVEREQFAIIDWEYNAWGEKYPPFHDDNAVPQWFSDTFGIQSFKPGMVLEGGSIDTNGDGVVLTTESVLLNANRNPDLSKEEIERRLYDYLGADQIIWLKKGLAGDDTDGHIDDLSRFVNRNTILTMITDDETDINYSALNDNLKVLEQSVDRKGEPFQIVTLPLPQTRIDGYTVDGSEYVPASYANFYIANDVVLVPLYDERFDMMAMDLFREFFPNREIIGIDCADLVWGQGSIHCITQQIYGIEQF